MSTHIAAKAGEIAEAVLLPGDPLRAKYIAEKFLENPHCYTDVRNMFGFTGNYKGKRVSVQGTGMGQPSISIYVNELFNDYGVKKAIRIGTIGAIQDDINLRDVILAQAACTDSNNMVQRFGYSHFAPISDFALLMTAYENAKKIGCKCKIGNVVSTDLFYDENENWKLWQKYGILGMEMEAAELFTLAAKYKRKALAILTVSDQLVKNEHSTAEERQLSYNQMIEIALETAVSQ